MKVFYLRFYYSKKGAGYEILERLKSKFGSRRVFDYPSLLSYPALDVIGESGDVEKSFFGENEIQDFVDNYKI